MQNASIIIPTRNRAQWLDMTLKSLLMQEISDHPYEILVVDNGSTDHTLKIVQKVISENPGQKISYHFEPVPGSMSARHCGALKAEGEILVFIDDDIEADKNWLNTILMAFENEAVNLVSGPSLPVFEADPPPWVAKYWTHRSNRFYCGSLSIQNLGDSIIEIDPTFVWSLNWSIRKKTFFEEGGFHPCVIPKEFQHFQGDGETGLSLKLRAKGHRALYVPGAKIFHHIPRERLTASYFEGRFFYQGVCDSYTQIRKSKGVKNILTPSVVPNEAYLSSLSAYESYQEIVHQRIHEAYVQGFKFHLEAVKNSEVILQWVLKDNYLDYKLPELNGYSYNRIQRQSKTRKNNNGNEIRKPVSSLIKKQLDAFQNSQEHERQSYYDHTKEPLKSKEYYIGLKDKLASLDISVDEEQIDLNDFKNWLQVNPEIKKCYMGCKDVIIEKCLEHYLSTKYLDINQKDIYIDIAAAGSPWADILNQRNIRSYRLDKAYVPGINGTNIGADACDTKLPSSSCTALSLHCAFECFMGEADSQFLGEAGRILSQNGRLTITPLYLEDTFIVVTSPFCDQKDVFIDKGAIRIWRDDEYIEPFSRHYSPEAFLKRVYSQLPQDMTGKVLFFQNLNEVMINYPGQRIYCYFMFYCQKSKGFQDKKNEPKTC